MSAKNITVVTFRRRGCYATIWHERMHFL